MSTWVPVVAAIVAAFAALSAPWVTFRLALRQDYVRWHRDQRAELYSDLLVEAHAEREWLQQVTADESVREQAAVGFTDLRLPPVERARLGARCTLFASRDVLRHFNAIQRVGFGAMLRTSATAGDDPVTRVEMSRAFELLEQAIRAEMRPGRVK